MKIETEFDAGDKIFYVNGGSILNKYIVKVVVEQTYYCGKVGKITACYRMGLEDYAHTVHEGKAYRTKEEAGMSILRANGLDVSLVEGK